MSSLRAFGLVAALVSIACGDSPEPAADATRREPLSLYAPDPASTATGMEAPVEAPSPAPREESRAGEESGGFPGVELGRYPAGGVDVDCPDLGYSVRVDGGDPHRLDADHDGIGCDSYLGRPIPENARLP